MIELDFKNYKLEEIILYKDTMFQIIKIRESFIAGTFLNTKNYGYIFAHEIKHITKLVNHELAQALYT